MIYIHITHDYILNYVYLLSFYATVAKLFALGITDSKHEEFLEGKWSDTSCYYFCG